MILFKGVFLALFEMKVAEKQRNIVLFKGEYICCSALSLFFDCYLDYFRSTNTRLQFSIYIVKNFIPTC